MAPRPLLHPLCWLTVFFCLCFLACAGEPAAARDLPPGEWLISEWQTEHGLPQNSVTALLQSRAGYLWVGTFNGLARFDGIRFVVFDSHNTPAMASSRITSLCEDDAGTLWVGTETGHLARLEDGQWRPVPIPASWPGGRIRAMERDENGALWLLHQNGLLVRLHDGRIIAPRHPGDHDAVASLIHDSERRLWVLREGRLSRLRAGALEDGVAPPSDHPVQAAAASAQGGLWLVTGDRLRRWHEGKWVADLGTFKWKDQDPIVSMLERRGGDVLLGTFQSGLRWYSAREEPRSLSYVEGLAHAWVRQVIEDAEGNLWLGTAGGLNRLRPRRVAMAPDLWQGKQLRAVAAGPGGDLWIGTEGAELQHFDAGKFTAQGSDQGLPNSYLWSALVDRQQRLWVGTWGKGLFQRTGEGSFAPAGPGWRPDALIVTALYEARDGAVWAGTERGLACWSGGKWSWIDTLPQVRTIVEDAAGNLWCGSSGNGLARIGQGGVISMFHLADGLSSDFIWALHAEPDGTLWIGTFGGGLCRWKEGRFSQVRTTHGLPSDVICHLADVGPDFWISSYAGLFRVGKEALGRCADGKLPWVDCLSLTRSDGLETLECSGGFQPAGARTADGRLWFPTAKGLAILDPARVMPHTTPPRAIIESALIDDHPPAPGAAVRVPPGRHRLEVRYTGLSFAAPERVHFRHRLLPLDTDWTEAGTARTATYHHLPPGRYSFELLACNGDGYWSPAPQAMEFTVEPLFWQTWWFRGTTLAAVGLLLFGAFRLRMRQLGEIQRVRLRIARDLHDEVGANLGSIALLSQVLEQQPNVADAGEVRRIATRTVEMLKEIVWLTNPAYDRLSALLPRMQEAVRQSLPGIESEFLTAGLPAELILPPSWRHHLLPIFKEALHNAARHAHPRRVSIAMRIERRQLELSVEDDGCGFDPATVLPGDGLLNLQRRARDMGAELDILSGPGGTTVRLRVTLP